MEWILYAISLIWVAIGSGTILYTTECRNLIGQLTNGVDRRIVAIPPAVVGILLIISFTASQNRWFVILLGVIAVLKGVFVFVNPKGYYDQCAGWYVNTASDQTYRLFGIIAILLGTTLMSWIL